MFFRPREASKIELTYQLMDAHVQFRIPCMVEIFVHKDARDNFADISLLFEHFRLWPGRENFVEKKVVNLCVFLAHDGLVKNLKWIIAMYPRIQQFGWWFNRWRVRSYLLTKSIWNLKIES